MTRHPRHLPTTLAAAFEQARARSKQAIRTEVQEVAEIAATGAPHYHARQEVKDRRKRALDAQQQDERNRAGHEYNAAIPRPPELDSLQIAVQQYQQRAKNLDTSEAVLRDQLDAGRRMAHQEGGEQDD